MDRLVRLTGRSPGIGQVVRQRGRLEIFGLWAVWLLITAAVARPQWLEDPVVQTIPARDLLLAVDLSGSMETEDMIGSDGARTDRLSVVKEVVGDFLGEREGDRVGLIFFGNAPFVQVPFTQDLEVCRVLLDEAQVRMAGPRTMLGDAIGKAVQVFEESTLEERVLILLTDGNDTGSLVPPVKAAELAAGKGIVIHVIAMGDPESTGEEKFDEETLKAVAEVSGGRYWRAIDSAALGEVYEELDRLTPQLVETVSYRPVVELYDRPLAGAVVLSLLVAVVGLVGRGRGSKEGGEA
jgi:Ca-activated chloride channel family protein